MTEKKRHIICFDSPVPHDYGGVIDVFFRLKALRNAGFYLILHCFYKGAAPKGDFSEIADEIYFYPRKTSFLTHISFLPYVVRSRMNRALTERLAQDKYPILAEGHHCAGILCASIVDPERVSVRIHNKEVDYYRGLAAKETNFFKKLYFFIESYKLRHFEKVLSKAKALYCLQQNDADYYTKLNVYTFYWRIGIDTTIQKTNENPANQVIYIGNLSVNENINAVLHLAQLWEQQEIKIPLLIAGKNPPTELSTFLERKSILLIPNPSSEKINSLLYESKFNIAYTDQATGMKIKLLNNLLKGNVCLVNDKMVENSDVSEFVTLFDSKTLKTILEEYAFSHEKMNKTKETVSKIYDPKNNIVSFF